MSKIAITGINGRMGQALVRQLAASTGVQLCGGTVRAGSPLLGQDAGGIAGAGVLGVKATDDLEAVVKAADVVIDFTRPELTAELAALAAEHGTALVIGTTGLDAQQQAALDEAAKKVPVLQAANMSIGVNLLLGLVEKVAATLDEEYDIEVLEMHHRHKVDAPSGTALALGQAAAKGRNVALDTVADKVRDGITGARKSGNIGFATLRGGDVIGDHTVMFAGIGERIELSHKASTREVFAQGAVRAAGWIAGKPAGHYTMKDVLGL
jgi:4-hydroxy-tetrahydrodipicolinate reductase